MYKSVWSLYGVKRYRSANTKFNAALPNSDRLEILRMNYGCITMRLHTLVSDIYS